MKVVLDTNVLVAAFATQGLCHALLELCVDQHEIVLSPDILKEAVAALQKKLKVPPKVASDVTEYLSAHACCFPLKIDPFFHEILTHPVGL